MRVNNEIYESRIVLKIVFSFSGALKIIFRTRGGGGRGTLFRLSEQYCNEVPYILGGSDWEIKE